MKNCNIPFTGILSLMVLLLLTTESIAQKKCIGCFWRKGFSSELEEYNSFL